MDDSWEDLVSNWEMGDEDFFNDQNHKNSFDEEEFFRDIIIEQPAAFTPHSEATSTNNNISGSTFDDISLEGHGGGGNMLKSSSSTNSIISSEKPSSSSSPKSYILCFDHNHSNNEPVCSKHYDPPLVSARKRPLNHESELLPEGNQRTKKGRDNCDREDHLMAERKRRQELTKRVIALSAIIPGLKKTDKAYILGEAVNYVKQLQERVRELENQDSKGREDSSTTILIKKTHCTNEATPSCEKNIDGCNGGIEELPEVEARVLEKEVLIGIHCEKQKHSLRKILSLLSDLHLSIASTSVLPFGTSTVQITIISKMDEEYNMTMEDLVKTIRQHLLNLKSEDMQQ